MIWIIVVGVLIAIIAAGIAGWGCDEYDPICGTYTFGCFWVGVAVTITGFVAWLLV